MFKTRGGGQRPFEQCSKKLHYWHMMASLKDPVKKGERKKERCNGFISRLVESLYIIDPQYSGGVNSQMSS